MPSARLFKPTRTSQHEIHPQPYHYRDVRIRIAFGDTIADPKKVQLVVDGWNIEKQTHHKNTL